MLSDKRWRRLLVWNLSQLLACDQSAPRPRVEWEEPRLLASELASAGALAFDGRRLVGRDRLHVSPPVFPRQCEGSTRLARDSANGDWYAAWWSERANNTADLLASHSPDGVKWTAPVRVDTADAGRVGCDRPPPSVTADRGNFYLAYAMTAHEGPGIFASHSMDRGRMFHAPVAVVYGERIGHAAIAARGDTVVIAFEDPNTEPRRISLALSRTMGHLFQSRMPVSPPGRHARAPQVALGNGRIAVAWIQGGANDAGSSAQRMVRVGEIR